MGSGVGRGSNTAFSGGKADQAGGPKPLARIRSPLMNQDGLNRRGSRRAFLSQIGKSLAAGVGLVILPQAAWTAGLNKAEPDSNCRCCRDCVNCAGCASCALGKTKFFCQISGCGFCTGCQ